jgi:bifunctional non-homologous end joining protein LigD
VSFQSWTDDDHLRAPVFLRLRDDVDPMRCDDPRAARARASRNPGRWPKTLAQLASKKTRSRSPSGRIRSRSPTRSRLLACRSGAQICRRSPSVISSLLAQVSPYMLPHLADRRSR